LKEKETNDPKPATTLVQGRRKGKYRVANKTVGACFLPRVVLRENGTYCPTGNETDCVADALAVIVSHKDSDLCSYTRYEEDKYKKLFREELSEADFDQFHPSVAGKPTYRYSSSDIDPLMVGPFRTGSRITVE
jgi:hypothetical protein